MVQRELEIRQQQSGRSAGAEEVEDARNAVWDQLIADQEPGAGVQGARDLGHRGRDRRGDPEQPATELLNSPEFQTDGQFDLQKYQRWLRSSAAAQVIPLLEAQYGDQIRQGKLLRVVTADVYLSDPALWQAWRDANEKVTIELAAVVPRAVVPDSAVPVTEADARATMTSTATSSSGPPPRT
jgi:hypothetical protein